MVREIYCVSSIASMNIISNYLNTWPEHRLSKEEFIFSQWILVSIFLCLWMWSWEEIFITDAPVSQVLGLRLEIWQWSTDSVQIAIFRACMSWSPWLRDSIGLGINKYLHVLSVLFLWTCKMILTMIAYFWHFLTTISYKNN